MDFFLENMQFESSKFIQDYFRKTGYIPGWLANQTKFPNPKNQIRLVSKWYPHTYFAKTGSYDAKATLYATMMVTEGNSFAYEYASYSYFMTSFREIILFVFQELENTPGKIALPAGGIPYYIPSGRPCICFDTDSKLLEIKSGYPNCEFIIQDIFNISGLFDIICCLGFSFYLKNLAELDQLIQKLSSCLLSGGKLIFNFILDISEQGVNNKNFQIGIAWNMAVLDSLNKNPKFNNLYIKKQDLLDICSKYGLENQKIYMGTLAIHAVAIFKKI